jgi:GH18 family chitinase
VPYEDDQSIQAKGEWSMAHGYGGVIIWTLEEMPHDLMVAAAVGFLGAPIGP